MTASGASTGSVAVIGRVSPRTWSTRVAGVAPGLGRDYFGFLGWKGHDAELWMRLRDEARARRDEGLRSLQACFHGSDADAGVLAEAKRNAQSAGINSDVVALAQRFGMLMAEYNSAIGDGKISVNEAKRLLRETLAIQQVLLEMKLNLEEEASH